LVPPLSSEGWGEQVPISYSGFDREKKKADLIIWVPSGPTSSSFRTPELGNSTSDMGPLRSGGRGGGGGVTNTVRWGVGPVT